MMYALQHQKSASKTPYTLRSKCTGGLGPAKLYVLMPSEFSTLAHAPDSTDFV